MMAKIEREYYSINEASEIICCSVADLVHLAARGDIRFVVLTSGLPAQRIRQNIIEEKQPYEYIEDKFCYVSQDNVAEYEANHSSDDLKISWVYPDDDLENGWGLHKNYVILMTNDSLYMLTADINFLTEVPIGAEIDTAVNIGTFIESGIIVQSPWLIPDLNDPQAKYPWYIPARYFARNLIKDDSTLLIKRTTLAKKIVVSLTNVGIYKRGGKKPYSPVTILKALANVLLG